MHFRWQTILAHVLPPSHKTIYNFKLVVGHTTKQMKHSRVCDVEIWWTRGWKCHPRVIFPTLGSSYFTCDKSQYSVATRVKCGGIFGSHLTAVYASEKIKIGEHVRKLHVQRWIVSCTLCAWPLAYGKKNKMKIKPNRNVRRLSCTIM